MQSKGLARYQPWEPVTPTMTAEAWVCRQFLGVGGPGPSSSEAAEFLLRNDSDRGKTNVYYWYYATLALYQHGGEPWTKWNAKIRDKIVGLQSISGHQTGKLGARYAAFTGRRGAGSTARPSPPFRSRSTTATCGSTTNPRSRWKPGQRPTGGPSNATRPVSVPRRVMARIDDNREPGEPATTVRFRWNATVVRARPSV